MPVDASGASRNFPAGTVLQEHSHRTNWSPFVKPRDCSSASVSRSHLPPFRAPQIALVAIILSLLLFVLACGSGNGSRIMTPPPQGNFSNASLKGQYTYSLSGVEEIGATAGSASFTEGGVFTADGSGNITNGTDDFSQNGSFGSATFTGTYTIHNDGTGTLVFTFSNGTGNLSLGVTLIDKNRFYLIEADTFASGGGSGEMQDSTAFSSVPSGTFAFRTHGNSNLQGTVAEVGAMTLSGGNVTGNADMLSAGVLSSVTLSGSIAAPGSNGRGTLSISTSGGTTSNFVYYVVNASTLRLLQTDSAFLTLGRAEKQTSTTFSTASLSGNFAFGSQGDTNATLGGVQTVGVFTSDGNGTITAGSFDSVQDGNQFTAVPFIGSYTMSSAGRAAVTFNPRTGVTMQEVFWMVSPTRAFFVINSATKVEDGTIDQQQTTAFSTSSLNGQFAFVMDGFDSATFVDRVGTLQTDGRGNLSLNELLNRFVPPNLGSITTPGVLAGTYSVASNGRVSANIPSLSSNLVFYMVSSSFGYTLQNDSATQISGNIALQVSP